MQTSFYNELVSADDMLINFECDDPSEEFLQDMILNETGELSDAYLAYLEENMIEDLGYEA